MCRVLKISRSTYYYKPVKKENTDILEQTIKNIFKDSRNNYGTRKIKIELSKLKYIVSRRKISRIMKKSGLVSSYTKASYKPVNMKIPENEIGNLLNREFKSKNPLEILVSDLTYVRVNSKWNYICLFVDIFNRQIVGYSVGRKKNAELVYRALAGIKVNLKKIKIFHSDRGSEFNNHIIDEALDTFGISRSLSRKGNPYDNAVAESTFKIFKTEFINNSIFSTLNELEVELADYINWFNNCRIHSTLGYLSPIEFLKNKLKKTV